MIHFKKSPTLTWGFSFIKVDGKYRQRSDMIKSIKTINPELSVNDVNSCVFIVDDITDYNNIEPDCLNLYVLPPGFSEEQVIHIEDLMPGFRLIVDKCVLGLQKTSCIGDREELGDGLYVFKLIVDGKEVTKKVYRLNRLYKVYYNILCCLSKKANNTQFQEDMVRELSVVRVKLDAIKSLGEGCDCVDKADIMYKDVQKLLKSINCKYCDCK
jgi:hypothetical protein